MKLTEDEKMMIVSGHAQAIVNMAGCGYAVGPSQMLDVVERVERMREVLAGPVSETAAKA